MKHLYFALSILICSHINLNAQNLNSDENKLKPTLSEVPASRFNQIDSQLSHRQTVWNESFSNGLNSSNGLWTVEGSDGNIWQYTDFVAEGCWSASGDAAVNFTTKNNGFMIFHADEMNCINPNPNPPLYEANSYQGALVSPAIDLSDVAAVLVSFEHRFRYCCDSDFSLNFSVSIDGGDNWTDYDITAETPFNEYNENIITEINISQIAANQNNVQFKYTWNVNNSASHYFWAIDDINVEVPGDNDISLIDVKYQQFDPDIDVDFTNVKHSIYHVSQVRPLSLQGVVVNKGATDQSNVQMSVEISTPDEVLYLNSPPQQIAVGDTGTFEIPYTPSGSIGTYNIVYSIEVESGDENPLDNFDALQFEMNDSFMARDDRSRSGGFNNYVSDLRTGLGYTMTEDATIYGIAVAIDNSSDIGAAFSAQLLNMNFNIIRQTETYTVEADMLNGPGEQKMVQLAFEAPYQVSAGQSLIPTFVFGGGDEHANVSLSGFCPDFTCRVWGEIALSGQECTPCFYNSVPMVRLIFAENVGIFDKDYPENVRLAQNVPNPAHDLTTLSIESKSHISNASLEIMDMAGKRVYYKQLHHLQPGTHTEVIDIKPFVPGIYLYSIKAPNLLQTKKMVVIK